VFCISHIFSCFSEFNYVSLEHYGLYPFLGTEGTEYNNSCSTRIHECNETVLILRRERDTIKSVYWSSCSAHYSIQSLMMNCLNRLSENTQNIKFNEKSVPWEPNCSPWAVDSPDEANGRFLQFCECT